MSDLDNEEIEATRMLKIMEEKELDEMIKSTEKSIEETCNFLKEVPFIKYKEKSADEMFEDLYYTKYNNPNIEIVYKKNEFHIIRFWKGNKSIIKQDENGFYQGINLDELQAINKKCKELGWLDE